MQYTEREDEKKHFVLRDLKLLTQEEFVEHIRDSGTSSALLFVHGFNTSFRDAIFDLAQIAWDTKCTKYGVIPIVFSWPSQGTIDLNSHPEKLPILPLEYVRDSNSATYSQKSFLELLDILHSSARVTKLYVIAHSMGNQIVVNALNQANYARQKHLLSEMILAAPDVDEDIFKQYGKALTDSARGITLYASSADKALRFSVELNGQNRAGYIPKGGPFTFPGIETIDVTAVGDDMLGLNHGTYSSSRSVLGDIGLILENGTHPPDRRSTEIRTYPEGSKHPKYWIFPW
jgi:esterase/lipase superfamily enzyme